MSPTGIAGVTDCNLRDEIPMPIHGSSSANMKPIGAGPQQGKGMARTILPYLALVLYLTANPVSAGDPHYEKIVPSNPYEVTGTLWELDLSDRKGLLRTDDGKPIYLEIKKPELFQNLSVGDRLTIHVNEDGQVDKVMGMSVPEFGITGQPAPQP